MMKEPDLDLKKASEKLRDSFVKSLRYLNPEKIMEEEGRTFSGKRKEGRLVVVGFGKASLPMYSGFRKGLAETIDKAAIIQPDDYVTPETYEELEVLLASHPVPDQSTLEASKTVIGKLKYLQENDRVVVLLSGGASSLFEIPAEGISMNEVSIITRNMIDNGADIYSLNRVRQAMSSVKGGKLIHKLLPARVFVYLISDVPGDSEAIIGSGPVSYSAVDKEEVEPIMKKYVTTREIDCDSLLNRMDFDFPPRGLFKPVKTKIILRNSDFANYISDNSEKQASKCLTLDLAIQGMYLPLPLPSTELLNHYLALQIGHFGSLEEVNQRLLSGGVEQAGATRN